MHGNSNIKHPTFLSKKEKKPVYVKKHVVTSPASHINIRSLAGNVTWRPRNRGHRASPYSVVIGFDVPLHPGALLPNWSQTLPCRPSNCGLPTVDFQIRLSSPKPAFRGSCFLFHDAESTLKQPFQIQVNKKECNKTLLTRNEQGKRKEWSYE